LIKLAGLGIGHEASISMKIQSSRGAFWTACAGRRSGWTASPRWCAGSPLPLPLRQVPTLGLGGGTGGGLGAALLQWARDEVPKAWLAPVCTSPGSEGRGCLSP
ncbi:unnamed protein product, partial [Heterosigma akashiwo]